MNSNIFASVEGRVSQQIAVKRVWSCVYYLNNKRVVILYLCSGNSTDHAYAV
jgi:hypothetical protein